MGKKFFDNLGGTCIYYCRECNVYLSNKSSIVSKNFTGNTGQAYLFKDVMNVRFGDIGKREMLTGLHYVRDVYCLNCDMKLGWMYELAFKNSELYKEGAITLEKALIKKVEGFEEVARVMPEHNEVRKLQAGSLADHTTEVEQLEPMTYRQRRQLAVGDNARAVINQERFHEVLRRDRPPNAVPAVPAAAAVAAAQPGPEEDYGEFQIPWYVPGPNREPANDNQYIAIQAMLDEYENMGRRGLNDLFENEERMRGLEEARNAIRAENRARTVGIAARERENLAARRAQNALIAPANFEMNVEDDDEDDDGIEMIGMRFRPRFEAAAPHNVLNELFAPPMPRPFHQGANADADEREEQQW